MGPGKSGSFSEVVAIQRVNLRPRQFWSLKSISGLRCRVSLYRDMDFNLKNEDFMEFN